MTEQHTPVLYLETIESLRPRDGAAYIDCTVGGAGHAVGLLEAAGPTARLLGMDADPEDLTVARERLGGFGDRVKLINANFRDLASVAADAGFVPVDGVLFDLGMSSIQLDQSTRGFSFQRDAPLDMRFDPSQPTTAADIVNSAGEADLRKMLFELGNERHASRLARAIVKRRGVRSIETTKDLLEVIVGAIGPRQNGIHSATKTFQALRIAVNQELESLREALPQALRVLNIGGRLAVISFHSLEDRIVKGFLRYEASTCVCPPGLPICVCGKRATVKLVQKKSISAGPEETRRNPRSRSARLRVAEKIT